MIVNAEFRSLPICVLLFLFPHLLTAQNLGPLYGELEDKLLRFQMEEAEGIIDQLPVTAHQNFYAYHVLLYSYMATQSAEIYEQLDEKWKPVVKSIESMPNTDPLRNVMLSELDYKRAAVEFMEKHYLSAIFYAKSSRSHIRKNVNRFPHNVEQLKVTGLFNVIFGAVPKKYQWITHALGYKGDLLKGLEQLEKASEKSCLLRMESVLIQYYVTKNMFSRPEEAITQLEAAWKKEPNSIIMDFFLAMAYMGVKKNDKALGLLEKRYKYVNDKQVLFFPFWDYMLAKAYYYKGNHDGAQRFFNTFLKSHKGNFLLTDATFRLGMAYTLSGRYTEAQTHFRRLANGEISDLDEDEFAKHMAAVYLQKEPSAEDKSLFLARNASDGGYYQKALDLLSPLKEKTPHLSIDQLTELHYRYGRIYQLKKQATTSRVHLLKCIEQKNVARRTLWFQAYACFHMAEMARQDASPDIAKYYCRKVLEYDKYFYQPSLENRSKIMLKELKG